MANDYLSIVSEIKELESLLADIPSENVIERLGLESRLKSAQQALSALPQEMPSKARLTFRGKPVFDSYGIAADFAGKAANAFSEAFAAVAAGLTDGLRNAGPIPNREKNQLLITGTAIGSFGFEFELPAPEPSLFPEAEKANEAMMKIEELLRLAAEGSDDEVTEVVEEVHPRAVKKLHDFLALLVEQEAWCSLEFKDKIFRYEDYEQIKSSHDRLKSSNIQEGIESFRGKFEGTLPTARTFEFRSVGDGNLIRGKLDQAIDNPEALNVVWLNKPVTAQFHVMQVGQGRPRFTLKSLSDLSE